MSTASRSVPGQLPVLVAAGVVAVASLTAIFQRSTVTAPAAAVNQKAPQLVTPLQIRRFPPDTPEGTLLRFWQALQYGDVTGARQLASSAAAKLGTARFSRLVAEAGPRLGGLRVEGTTVSDGRANVRVLVLAFAGRPTHIASESPTSLPLARSQTFWQVSSLSYFLQRAPGLSLKASTRGTARISRRNVVGRNATGG